MVQDFNCEQMRVSGFNSHNEFVLVAEEKAKTVTTVPAEALAKAGQLTFIVLVSCRAVLILG
jgi:hypothetical protein